MDRMMMNKEIKEIFNISVQVRNTKSKTFAKNIQTTRIR